MRSLPRYLACLIAFAFPLTLGAAGLGAIEVRSALGQPLVAEAPITSLQPKEFESLIVRMATSEEFKAAGIPYVSVIRNVRIEPATRANGQPVLRFTTVSAVNEPSLEMLVDFRWPNGRLLQKYSILLDPAR